MTYIYYLKHVSKSRDLETKDIFDLTCEHVDSSAGCESADQRVRHVSSDKSESQKTEYDLKIILKVKRPDYTVN